MPRDAQLLTRLREAALGDGELFDDVDDDGGRIDAPSLTTSSFNIIITH